MLLGLVCLLWKPGQGAGDGLYFFSGILQPRFLCHTPHSFNASSVLAGVLQHSYWQHVPGMVLSSTLSSQLTLWYGRGQSGMW
jgi:hypothetical protein